MSRGRLASMFVIAILCVPGLAEAAPGDRSPDGLWLEVDRTALGDPLSPLPDEFRAYLLDFDALVSMLTEEQSIRMLGEVMKD